MSGGSRILRLTKPNANGGAPARCELRPVSGQPWAAGVLGEEITLLLHWCGGADHTGSLMEVSVLFSLKRLAEKYPRNLPLGNPLPPFAIQNVGARWRVCHFSCSLI